MYENNVDVTVREAFLFMVKVYSKPFPLVKKKKKNTTFSQLTVNKAENILERYTAFKLSSNTFHPNKNTASYCAELFE